MIDMSLLCPVETPCPGMTTTRCVAPIKARKLKLLFFSHLLSEVRVTLANIVYLSYIDSG